MPSNADTFIRLVKHPLKFRLFLLSKLPAAYFSGVRVKSIDENTCVVGIKYKWFNRNPFRSTYFACLAMAGEMSTGALAMAHLYKRNPAVSMLVVKVESYFYKKATGPILFTCNDGLEIKEVIETAIATGESQTLETVAIGKNTDGEEVAMFLVTWSFKKKG